MKQSKFPPSWDEKRVQKVIAHYEQQTEAEAVAEDEAAFGDLSQTVIEIPKELVPAVRELLAKHLGNKVMQSG
ncbi:hypothetical protein FJZ31_29250 [Candidatus Poribacteria bacterium]|nr:hypothetical protein [Candidatus Poribacteria bacterium]